MNFMTRLLLKKNSKGLTNSVTNLITLSVLILLMGSCAKDPGQIGYNIQPEDSRLNVAFSDTSTIYAYSELIDSIRTDNLSANAFGSLRDPVFGSTTAGFYTQFSLSFPEKDFGTNRVLDSLVFQLDYIDQFGDTNATLVAHTYQMYEGIDDSSAYYSILQLPLGATDYSNYSFVPNISDSVIVDSVTLPPMLRLNLSDISTELGQYLLDATVTNMESNDVFREYFNGLFIQSEPVYEDGTIVNFELTSSYSELKLYYSNDSATGLVYDYIMTSSTASVNKYEHSYSSASPEFKSQLVDGDTMLGQHQYYVQGYGGSKALIKIPHIFDWAKKENVAINEAKLVLPGVDDSEFLDYPAQLALLSIQEDDGALTLLDQNEGDGYFGGYYNDDNNTYEFRITRYIQSLINDTTMTNKGLYLYMYGGTINPERFIFKGNNSGADTTGIRLELLYTDL